MLRLGKIIWLLCLLNAFNAWSQNDCVITLAGEVLKVETHEPIPFATLLVKGENDGVQTDANGHFSIKLKCNSTVTLEVSQVEFQKKSITINTTSEAISQDFYLAPKEQVLSSVTVHSHKRENSLLSNVENSLNTPDLLKLKGKSLSETASNLPGVYNIKTGPGINKPMIHGMYGSRIQIVNNEVAQMGQQWGVDHAPEIDPFLASRITVVKGASALKYGPRAMGGALLLQPEPLDRDSSIRGSLDVVGFTNGRGIQGSAMLTKSFLLDETQSINVRIQSSGKKSGDQQAANYNLTNTGSEELNFSTAANYISNNIKADLFYSYFSTEIGILRGAHVGNVDNFFEALNKRPPFFTEDFSYEINNPKQNVVHQLFKSKVHYDWADYGDVDFIYSYQRNNRQEFDIRRGGRSDQAAVDLQLDSHLAKLLFHHEPIAGNLNGEMGLDYEYRNNENVPGTGTTPLIPNYSSVQVGAFVNESWRHQQFLFEAGLRYDYMFMDVLRYNNANQLENFQHRFNLISAIIGTAYQLNADFNYTSNVSLTQRPPSINELYSQGLHHSVAAIEEGDNNLQPESALKWLHSLQYNVSEKFRLKASLYASGIDNYIYLEPQEPRLTIRGAFPVYQYKQTRASLVGGDFIGSYEFFHHFQWSTKASIIRGADLNNNIPLIFMPADRWENSLNWRINQLNFFKRVELKLTGLQVFKQYRAPITETQAYERAVVPVPEGYFLTSFSADFTKDIGNSQLNVGLSIYNLTNEDYTDYLNRLRYYAAEPGRNFELRLNYIF